MTTHRVIDELVWIPELELAMSFSGEWEYEVIAPPPFPVLSATSFEVPLRLETYCIDPDYQASAEAVAWDLVHARLDDIESEEYSGGRDTHEVQALGREDEANIEIRGHVFVGNEIFYVMAFSGPPGLLDKEAWRLEAMLGSVTVGEHRAYGRGVEGLLNWVGDRLQESGVILGRSRGQLSAEAQQRVRRDRRRLKLGMGRRRHRVADSPDPPLLPTEEDDLRSFDEQLGLDDVPETRYVPPGSELPMPARRPTPDASFGQHIDDALSEFDSKLAETPDVPIEAVPFWPEPFLGLPLSDPRRVPRQQVMPRSFKARSAGRRELEIVAFAEGLPADVAFHAVKLTGVPDSIGHRDNDPFPVLGLCRIALGAEAVLRIRQSELDPDEPLEVGEPRRAISPLGRQVGDGQGITVQTALVEVLRNDDHTATDVLGWRLGWREVQERLPAFGLNHHSMLSPIRARQLALTRLAGPLSDVPIPQRIDLWRSLSEDERRDVIGRIHKANLETPLDELTNAVAETLADNTITMADKARWTLALGPRGCAQEYANLVAAIHTGSLLSTAHSRQLAELLGPCAGDLLTGAGHGEFMKLGKLGQGIGVLGGAGIVMRNRGPEIAMAVLTRNVQTRDHAGLAEQLRVLGHLIYAYLTDL